METEFAGAKPAQGNLHTATRNYIPWLEKKIEDISEDNMKEFNPQYEEMNKEKIYLFEKLSQTIPIYLRGSFHRMRYNMESANFSYIQQYWQQTFRFLYCCSTFDHSYVAEIIDKIKHRPDFCDHLESIQHFPEVYKEDDTVPRKPMQCTSAAEFLMEPWILIQMPFQPVMLHQWAAALLAEALQFQKKISPIYSYGPPAKLATINATLRKMLRTMKSCAKFMLELFHTMGAKGLEKNIQATLYTEMEGFSNHLCEVLPILKFVTSEDASSVIDYINRICLAELNGAGKTNPIHLGHIDDVDKPIPIYDFLFWYTKCDPRQVFIGVPRRNTVSIDDLLINVGSSLDGETRIKLKTMLKKIATEEVIQPGRLRGVYLETVMAVIEREFSTMIVYPILISQYYIFSSEGFSLTERENGVLKNIIQLYADVKISEITDVLTRLLFEEVKKNHPGVEICNPLAQRTEKTHSIQEIESQLNQICTNKEWTWDKILADAKLSCCLTEQTSIEVANWQPKEVAQHFQSRIKRLVYKIAEKHLATLKAGQFEFVPEHQFVQYALPCLVLLYQHLCKNASVGLTAEKKFERFVDSLITNYEQYEYVQVLSPEKKAPLQNQRDLKCFLVNLHPSNLVRMLSCYIQEKAAVQIITCSLNVCLPEFVRESTCIMNERTHKRFPAEHQKWSIQMDMFLNRVQNVMEDLVPCENHSRKVLIISDHVDRAINTSDRDARVIYCLFANYVRQNAGQVFHSTEVSRKMKMNLDAVPKAMSKSAQRLSCQQLAGLFVYLHFYNTAAHSHWAIKYQGPGFPMDMGSIFIWSAATDDRWKIKQLVGPMLVTVFSTGRRGKRTCRDDSLVSFKVALFNPCYRSVLKLITPERRVRMQHPGEITFVPVKHCRWCGLIEVEKFRLCPECSECPNYWDVNYFCSEKCETEALDSQHREEHARYYEVKLGLNN